MGGCSRELLQQQQMIYGDVDLAVRPTSAGSVSSSSSAGVPSIKPPRRGAGMYGSPQSLSVQQRQTQLQHLGKGDVIHTCKRLGLPAPLNQAPPVADIVASPTKQRRDA